MSETRLDPELESLAAKLAAQSPRLPVSESQELLYRCAFAAGQSATARNARQWQGLSATLALLLAAAALLPLATQQRRHFVNQTIEVPSNKPGSEASESPRLQAIAGVAVGPSKIDLDAWQQPADAGQVLEQGLIRFANIDPALRSLAVANLSRCAVDQQ